MFFPAAHLPQILELHCIDEKMHCAPSSYTSTTESFSMQSGTKVTQLSLSYSRWVQRSCVTPRDVPQSWKHAASFPGFQGKLAAPNILQKKDLEQWKKSLSLHPLLDAMVSPAQRAVYKCSSGPVKSWPRFFKLSQRGVLSEFSLQVIRFTKPHAKEKKQDVCASRAVIPNLLQFNDRTSVTDVVSLLQWQDGEGEGGWWPTGSRFFLWPPQS